MDMKRRSITEAQYQELRAITIEQLNHFNVSTGGVPDPNIKLTCDECRARHDCEFSADSYNIDGDCLAEK